MIKQPRVYPRTTYTKVLQLKCIINPINIKLRGGGHKQIEKNLLLLISNHLENTASIIGLFNHHLFMSENVIASKIAQSLQKNSNKKPDSNLIEYYEEQSLNAAIVFANSSFDYMQILLALFFIPTSELKKITKTDIRKKMKNSGLESQDWYLAFFSLIQTQFQNTRTSLKGWYVVNKNIIPTRIAVQYENIEKINRELRTKYQANVLKHYGITAFAKSNLSNILRRSYANFNIDAFYSGKIKKVAFGSRKNELKIDVTHDFLFDYLKRVVKLHNDMYKLLI